MKTIKIIFAGTSVHYMLVLKNEPIIPFLRCLERQKNVKVDYYKEVVDC